ncbi:hypothetical protein MTO96_042179 [Rhipicephalus appendiculatus]
MRIQPCWPKSRCSAAAAGARLSVSLSITIWSTPETAGGCCIPTGSGGTMRIRNTLWIGIALWIDNDYGRSSGSPAPPPVHGRVP